MRCPFAIAMVSRLTLIALIGEQYLAAPALVEQVVSPAEGRAAPDRAEVTRAVIAGMLSTVTFEAARSSSDTALTPFAFDMSKGPVRVDWREVETALTRILRARPATSEDRSRRSLSVLYVRETSDSLFVQFAVSRARRCVVGGKWLGAGSEDYVMRLAWSDRARSPNVTRVAFGDGIDCPPALTMRGSPLMATSEWRCRNLTPARAGAHLRYEFRLGGTIAAAADTSLGDAHRVVELAFDQRGELIQFRDRAPVTEPAPGIIELAGVRDAYGALSARERSPTVGGGTRTRELASAELDAVLRTARAFWDQQCSA